jgi:DNA-binding MarR family transcriptional regulator
MGDWTLFSNHGHVLVCLARDKEARLRNVANDVGITERAVQKIVGELQQAGFITISKHGRCNRYDINTRKALRHALEAKCTVGRLLQLFVANQKRTSGFVADESEAAVGMEAGAPQVPDGQAAVADPVEPPGQQQSGAVGGKGEAPGKEKKTRTQKETVDTRQQGSLF